MLGNAGFCWTATGEPGIENPGDPLAGGEPRRGLP